MINRISKWNYLNKGLKHCLCDDEECIKFFKKYNYPIMLDLFNETKLGIIRC